MRRFPSYAQATFYGSVVLMKAKCPACGSLSIVLDEKSACCDVPIVRPDRFRSKREGLGEDKRSRIPQSVREQIIKSQGSRCIYCMQRLDGAAFNRIRNKAVALRVHIDHFICWKFSRDNSYDNLLAACHICNGIKSDYLFESFLECQNFILHRRAQRGWVDEEIGEETAETIREVANKNIDRDDIENALSVRRH